MFLNSMCNSDKWLNYIFFLRFCHVCSACETEIINRSLFAIITDTIIYNISQMPNFSLTSNRN